MKYTNQSPPEASVGQILWCVVDVVTVKVWVKLLKIRPVETKQLKSLCVCVGGGGDFKVKLWKPWKWIQCVGTLVCSKQMEKWMTRKYNEYLSRCHTLVTIYMFVVRVNRYSPGIINWAIKGLKQFGTITKLPNHAECWKALPKRFCQKIVPVLCKILRFRYTFIKCPIHKIQF